MKALIGITPDTHGGRRLKTRTPSERIVYLWDRYIEALLDLGAMPVILPVTEDEKIISSLVGCFDLRFGHPEPGVVWFGALILRDELPTDRLELETWAVRILEEWLSVGTDTTEIRLALLVSDHDQVRFWTQMGYTATRQSYRHEIDGKRQRFVVYGKRIPRVA